MKVADLNKRLAAALARRAALLAQPDLEAVRLLNGEGDGFDEIHVDRFGPFLLAHVGEGLAFGPIADELIERFRPQALFRHVVPREARGRARDGIVTELDFAADPTVEPGERRVRERDLTFLVRVREGWSAGLFVDQRDNRARAARRCGERPGARVLNTFAFTCAFSVAAARAGALTTSVDLSARYLAWGRENFAANGLDAEGHEFVRGDAVTYLEIAARKSRQFELVILDPPTFSTSRQRGTFQVERDYARLFELGARVAAPDGVILVSHNQRTFARAALAAKLKEGARAAGRTIARLEPFAPPADFPGRDEGNPAARGFWVTLR